MDANLEIMRMRKEIVEVINQHNMPIAITTLLLKDILSEAQLQCDHALEVAIREEKEDSNENEE